MTGNGYPLAINPLPAVFRGWGFICVWISFL